MFSMLQVAWPYLRARFSREDGAAATEYGLLLALVAIVIIGALIALGLALNDVFTSAGDTVGSTT
jgi:pilus assembly protein Flp/PilA